MKSILVPTDFSATADHAARYALTLSGVLRTDITLCHVNDAANDEQDKRRMESFVHRLNTGEHGGHQGFLPLVKVASGTGKVVPVVTEMAKDENMPLIVMGMAGAGKTRQAFGHHSRDMIDAARSPLLLVPAAAPLQLPKRIVFATDLHQRDIPIACSLATFARDLRATLMVVHVSEKHESDSQKLQADEFAGRLKQEAQGTEIQFKSIENANVEEGLDQLIKNGEADMLAMSHARHSWMDQVLDESHTQQVAKHLSVPLLIYPKHIHSASMVIF